MGSGESPSEEKLGEPELGRRPEREGGAAELGMDGGEAEGSSSLSEPGSERG